MRLYYTGLNLMLRIIFVSIMLMIYLFYYEVHSKFA